MMRNPWPIAGALALLGCGSADDEQAEGIGPRPRYPVPGCEHIDHAPCDIGERACQERLLQLTVCLRGGETIELPPVTVMSEQAYGDYYRATIEEIPRPVPDHYERALVMLGLVAPGAFNPPALVAETVPLLGGVYRQEERDIVLIEHGEPLAPEVGSPILVHEFVHALQDHDVGLDAFSDEYSTGYDAMLAARALVEGEARLHEDRYFASVIGLDPARVDFAARYAGSIQASEDWVVAQASRYLASNAVFPYSWGGRFVHQLWSSEGFDAVLARYASPPRFSHTLMQNVDEAASEEVETSEPAEPMPSEEWSLVASTRIGAWGLFLTLVANNSLEEARSTALGWRGDQLWVYADGSAEPRTTMVWRIEFADETSALEAELLANVALVSLEVQRTATLVTFAASSAGPAPDWATSP